MKMTDFNLPANLDIDNHRDLPGLVKHGIRLGFIATVRRETVRQVARLVDQARAAAIPDSDILIVLASAMMHDRPDGFASDWHPRSEERRVGKECVSTCSFRWWAYI